MVIIHKFHITTMSFLETQLLRELTLPFPGTAKDSRIKHGSRGVPFLYVSQALLLTPPVILQPQC